MSKKSKKISLQQENTTEEVFVSYFATDNNGVVYTDLTGKLPMVLIDGCKYILELHHYDSNAILVKPLRNRSNEESLRVCKEFCDDSQKRGFNIELHIFDNEASISLKSQIQDSNTGLQLV